MRIWFNHWFSAIDNVIDLLKAKFSLYVIGSNTNQYAVYKHSCDEWYQEPECHDGDAYCSYALDFCKTHNIDVLIPRRFLLEIAEHLDLFTNIGVKVLCSTHYDVLKILFDKCATYDYITSYLPDLIPEYYICKSADEFKNYYEILSKKYDRICYKLVHDEGASSFRIIEELDYSEHAIYHKLGNKIPFEFAIKIIENYSFKYNIIIMPYLQGPEVSVDCLNTDTGKIIIPRFKTDYRYSIIKFDPEILDTSSKLMDILKLQYPYNIQYRFYPNQQLKLLEINPRISGGIQQTCAATNLNIPALALAQLLGQPCTYTPPAFKNYIVSHIEHPVVLNV